MHIGYVMTAVVALFWAGPSHALAPTANLSKDFIHLERADTLKEVHYMPRTHRHRRPYDTRGWRWDGYDRVWVLRRDDYRMPDPYDPYYGRPDPYDPRYAPRYGPRYPRGGGVGLDLTPLLREMLDDD